MSSLILYTAQLKAIEKLSPLLLKGPLDTYTEFLIGNYFLILKAKIKCDIQSDNF